MPLNGCLNPLWLDTDVTLRDSGRAMLQKPLDKGNVIPVILVNLRGVPLAEAVGADTVIAQVVTNQFQLLLDSSGGDGEDQVIFVDAMSQTVVFNILSNDYRHSENALLAGLLLNDLQVVAPSVLNNVPAAEIDDVTDPDSQICFQNQRCGNTFIRAAATKALFHSLDDLCILLCGESFRCLVHRPSNGNSSLKSGGKFVFWSLPPDFVAITGFMCSYLLPFTNTAAWGESSVCHNPCI